MIKKHQIGLYLHNGTKFVRIMKSTTLTVEMNAETETFDYISDESPTEELKSYKPSIEQDLRTIKGNEDYEMIKDKFFNLRVGSEAETEAMVVFMANPGVAANSYEAWKSKASIVVTNLDAVASTINFNINFGGTVARGEATLDETGQPVFKEVVETPASASETPTN